MFPPTRIVCLTEETVETLYLLGEQDRIVGVSGYVVRPPQARREKQRVSAFISADIPKILALNPDLVLTFSDLQAGIVADLIRAGVTVHAFNHRTIAGILDMIRMLGAMVGKVERAIALVNKLEVGIATARENGRLLPRHPKVFFEEWNDPLISGIAWVSELIEVAGGVDIFPEKALGQSAKERIVQHEEVIARQPDLIIGSWCGKKFQPAKVKARPGFEQIPAVQRGRLHEIKSPIILQPGPGRPYRWTQRPPENHHRLGRERRSLATLRIEIRMTLAELRLTVEQKGIAWRGAFHPVPSDGVPATLGEMPTATLVLLGFTGTTGWQSFTASPEMCDGHANPLDRWSRRIIGGLAAKTGAVALYPFEGPPWHPFQRWAQRAESIHPSPLGTLIHPDWGLWHSYRGALAFSEHFALEPTKTRPSPCATCRDQPCLTTCPVAAFSSTAATSFDDTKCRGFLSSPAGQECLSSGCQARRACPIGADYRYDPAQASFHMRAFYGK